MAELFETLRSYLEIAGQLHPALFFTLMAVLTAIGFPLSLSWLIAGSLYNAQLAIIGSGLASAVSLVITFVLCKIFRKRLIPYLQQKGWWKGENKNTEKPWQWTILIRVAPGVPFAIQSALISLAGVPLWIYLTFSILWVLPVGVALILLGESFFSGDIKIVFIAIFALVLLYVLTSYIRKRALKSKSGGTSKG